MRVILTFVFSLLSVLVCSQTSSENALGSWYTYTSSHRLSNHVSLSPGVQFRFYEPSSNYNLALFSLAGNYHINSVSKAGFGYAYIDIDTVFEFDNIPNIREHRLFEEYNYTIKKNKLKILHRGRLEHRFLDFKTTTDIQHRFRYRLSFIYEINAYSYAMLSEEPFVNFQDQVFHENRLYLGVGFNIMKHSKLQIGYLKQHINKRNLNRFQVGISITSDHRKPKNSVAIL